MTNIACVSDLHENLIEIPECDLLLIAGDITYGFYRDLPAQQKFIYTKFKRWVEEVPARHIVTVAGNHDQNLEAWGWPVKHEWPENFHYLQDEGVEIDGLKIWGTPWQPWFYSWAFNAPERNGEEFLKDKFDMIPDDTDIVICHGPPYGCGDRVGDQNDLGQPRAGSKALTNALQRVNPRLMVCGHIHAGTGEYRLEGTQTHIINAAIVNEKYKVKRGPFMVRLQPDKRFEKCYMCGGLGEVSEVVVEGPEDYNYTEYNMRCDACDGDGRIRVNGSADSSADSVS